MTGVLQLIRQGVKLKHVDKDTAEQARTPQTPSDDHIKQLEEVLGRICKKLNLSSDDETSDNEFED